MQEGNLVGDRSHPDRNYGEGRRVYIWLNGRRWFWATWRDDTANRSNIEEQMPEYALGEDDFPFSGR